MQVLAVGAHRFFDLRRQLAGGRQDQGANGSRLAAFGGLMAGLSLGAGLAGVQALQQRQREGGGFAGAGLCAGQQVVASQHQGDGLRLHRGGLGVALLAHGVQQSRGEVQFVKSHG